MFVWSKISYKNIYSNRIASSDKTEWRILMHTLFNVIIKYICFSTSPIVAFQTWIYKTIATSWLVMQNLHDSIFKDETIYHPEEWNLMPSSDTPHKTWSQIASLNNTMSMAIVIKTYLSHKVRFTFKLSNIPGFSKFWILPNSWRHSPWSPDLRDHTLLMANNSS